VQYNKTDITPVAQMEQVMAGEPVIMLCNCVSFLVFLVVVGACFLVLPCVIFVLPLRLVLEL
jgi:hypothetical protein